MGSLRATCSPDPRFARGTGRILTRAHRSSDLLRKRATPGGYFTRALGAVGSKYRRTRESALVRQSHFGCRAALRQAAILREKQYLSSPFVCLAYSSMKAAKPSSDQNCPRRLNLFWFCEHCDSMAPLPIGAPSAAFPP